MRSTQTVIGTEIETEIEIGTEIETAIRINHSDPG
jgi:hypothetical protein